jgi:hypothetical protein
MRYWTIIFVISLAALTIVAVYWHPFSNAVVPLAVGIGCVANWAKNRTYHCGITGPIFILAGAALLLAAVGYIHVQSIVIWALAVIGTVVALYLESRYAEKSGANITQ